MKGSCSELEHDPFLFNTLVDRGCALVTHPALILADEPTGNLDSEASREIMDVLMKLNAEEAMTIVLVTHEPDIAAVARRVIMMKDGVVLSDRPARVAGDQLTFQPTT